MDSYTNQFRIKTSREATLQAILSDVHKWWTTTANQTEKIGDELLVSFNIEGTLFMKMKIMALKSNSLVVWEVIDDNMSLDGSIPEREWVGTIIKWKLSASGNETILHFEHNGLTPQLICYEVCERGWNHYLNSFVDYLNTGTGNPAIVKQSGL